MLCLFLVPELIQVRFPLKSVRQRKVSALLLTSAFFYQRHCLSLQPFTIYTLTNFASNSKTDIMLDSEFIELISHTSYEAPRTKLVKDQIQKSVFKEDTEIKIIGDPHSLNATIDNILNQTIIENEKAEKGTGSYDEYIQNSVIAKWLAFRSASTTYKKKEETFVKFVIGMIVVKSVSTGSRNQDPQTIEATRSNQNVTINHNSVTTTAKDYK
ncbi:hypothetical protein BDF21DRAFT_404689 [Thamnidium elegans]|nr:hypothetical protein BDF21DRAFT_404689 [Thamnidium elegans]